MNINQLHNRLIKKANIKKEALIAGVSSYADNAQDKPDEYGKNIAKALATELGAVGGGLGGLLGALYHNYKTIPPRKDIIIDKKKLPKKMSKKTLATLLAYLSAPIAGYGLGGYGTHKLTEDL